MGIQINGQTDIISAVDGSLDINGLNSVTVGQSFVRSTSIGIGTTTTAGRNAGINTAVGTIIYNETSGQLEVYKRSSGWVSIGSTTDGFTVTGGNISATLADGSKYHVFTASGDLVVSGSGSIDILMIAGGGGGGNQHGGGGGGGALYYNSTLPITSGTYSVTIGTGGVGGTSPSPDGSTNGNPTIFGPGTLSHIVVNGGGFGRRMSTPSTSNQGGGPGGCGGGGGLTPIHPSPPARTPGGSVTAPPTNPLPSPFIYGNAGGRGNDYGAAPNSGGGGGGGGCGPNGGPGTNEVPQTNGTAAQGGDDFIAPTPFLPTSAISILATALSTPTSFLGVPIPSPANQLRAFGGGGAGGSHSPWAIYNPGGSYPASPSPYGGGSAHRTGGLGGLGNSGAGVNGVPNRGAGGGGSGGGPTAAGNGSDGVIIIRYPQ